jgi:hypothetical protein|tara:strand:+ start:1439 stop:2026 length:588 start_codon:yes stop_codon:yes gene_type:complete
MKDYIIVKQAISKEICDFLCNYAMLKGQACASLKEHEFISKYDLRFGFFGDEQVPNPNTYCLYGDTAFDSLLLKLQPIIEREVKKELIPNYSFIRIYRSGDDLKKHKDRNSCEYSITLNLGGDRWPIFMGGDKCDMNQGDLVIYKGCDIEHWREPFDGNICIQCFLHYNEKTEATAKNLFDGRVALGTWATCKKE